ncbi:MAG: ATP-binding SpoIIE family protein phosphatase [Acidimicrobiales bacterium]
MSDGDNEVAAPSSPRDELDLTLVVEIARTLHGPTPLEGKLEWLLAAAARGAGCDVSFYVSFEDELLAGWPRPLSSADAAGAWAGHRSQLRAVLGSAWAAPVGRLGELFEVDAVAVTGADGRRRGALVLGNRASRPLDAGSRAVTGALAAHLGAALDHAETVRQLRQLEAAQRELAHQLQTAVRPSMPQVVDTELGVYYLAADPQEPTGGDLYDWRPLPDGDLHLAVVDVLGKGVAATKDALAVCHALRLLVLDGVPIGSVIRRADEILTAQDPDLVATVLIGRYRPETGELILAGGGHPPALVLRAEDQSQLVHAPGIPIGWPGAGSEAPVTVYLDRSDTVILYTDGLIESGKDIVAGLDALVRAGREVSDYPADHLARALVHRAIAGGRRRDDTVALVLRRRSTPQVDARLHLAPFVHSFRSHPAAVGVARHLLSDWLTSEPIDQTVVDDLLLVADELCANAVHAGPAGEVVLRAQVEGDDVVVEVEDEVGHHPGIAPAGPEHPDPMAERGRGLYLVDALSDSVEVCEEDGRTIVRCRKTAVVASK